MRPALLLLAVSLLIQSCIANGVLDTAKKCTDSAEILITKNKLKEAEVVLFKAVELGNNDAVAYNDIAVCMHKRNGPTDSVVFYFNKAKQANPLNPISYANLANDYLDIKMYDSALAEAIQAIDHTDETREQNKKFLSGTYDIAGKASCELGFPQASIPYLKKSIDFDNYNHKAYLHLSYAYILTGNYKDGIINADMALEIKPSSAQAYNIRGICFTNTGKYTLALADMNKAISLDSTAKEFYYDRGIIFENTNEMTKALSDYKKAFALGEIAAKEAIVRLKK